jgi:2-polyprenyl-3-methyl-5-hydroxy-6-metoxy-1,4-benzoquinol methylase
MVALVPPTPTRIPMPDSSIEQQTEYYDRFWAEHGFANRFQLERCAAVLRALHATKLKEPTIVEVGCGAGWLTAVLGHFGPALGVELSPAAVAAATERYPHARFLAADLTRWDHPRGEFDVVVSSEVIEHLEDQAQHARMAYELLRPGGFLILTTPNARTMGAMPEPQRSSWSTQPIEKWLTIAQLESLLVAQGFRIESAGTVVAGFGERGRYRIVNSHKVARLFGRLGFGETWHALRLAGGYGLHTVVLAQRG